MADGSTTESTRQLRKMSGAGENIGGLRVMSVFHYNRLPGRTERTRTIIWNKCQTRVVQAISVGLPDLPWTTEYWVECDLLRSS
jgi:hypothetical protein